MDFPRAARELGVEIDPIGTVEHKKMAVERVMAWVRRSVAHVCKAMGLRAEIVCH